MTTLALDPEAFGRDAARAAAPAWHSFWSGLTDCPSVRAPTGDIQQSKLWFRGYDAEVRRQRRIWLAESVHA